MSHAENKRFAADIRTRKAPHIPMNKRLIERLDPSLHEHGVHLPWTFSPMSASLRRRCEQVAKSGDLSFVVFYGQLADFSGPEVTLGRVFSNPLQLSGPSHTWMQPIYDEMLDDEVALLVESNALAAAR